MKFLQYHNELSSQMHTFKKFLITYEKTVKTERLAQFMAMQMQDFTLSGKQPLEYYEAVQQLNADAAETFMNTFRHYVQFTQTQYFEKFHKMRWASIGKHKKGVSL